MQVHAHQPLLALLLLTVLLVLLQSWPAAAEHPQAPISASASASASAATPDQAIPAAADESASPTPTTTTTTTPTTTTLPDDPDASGLPLLRPIAPPRPYDDPVDEEALTDDAGISDSQQPPCSDQHRHPGSTGDGQGQPSRGCCTSFRQDDSLLPSKMLRAFWGERDPFLGLEEVPTPEGTERVPPSVCGSRRVYWSDSCGAIGELASTCTRCRSSPLSLPSSPPPQTWLSLFLRLLLLIPQERPRHECALQAGSWSTQRAAPRTLSPSRGAAACC